MTTTLTPSQLRAATYHAEYQRQWFYYCEVACPNVHCQAKAGESCDDGMGRSYVRNSGAEHHTAREALRDSAAADPRLALALRACGWMTLPKGK